MFADGIKFPWSTYIQFKYKLKENQYSGKSKGNVYIQRGPRLGHRYKLEASKNVEIFKSLFPQ